MDLEIQTQNLDLDPTLRDLIERGADELSRRHAKLMRLHARLEHSNHHRLGNDRVTLVANLAGATLRTDKREADPRTALRKAFAALHRTLEERERERRTRLREAAD